MVKKDIERILKRNLSVLEKEYGVKALYLFGSYARNTETKNSDIDLLVELNEGIDLFTFIALKEYLQSLLKKKIDLVTRDAIRSVMISNIERDLVRVA